MTHESGRHSKLRQGVRMVLNTRMSRLTYGSGAAFPIIPRSLSGVLDFTCTLGVVFYNSRDPADSRRFPAPKPGHPGFIRSATSNTTLPPFVSDLLGCGTALEMLKDHGSNSRLPKLTLGETGGGALRRSPHHFTSRA